MSVTSTEFEIIELGHLDFEPACAPMGAICESTAKWMSITKCCGHELFLCDAHRADVMRDHRICMSLPPGVWSWCRACGERFDPVPVDYYRWVKL